MLNMRAQFRCKQESFDVWDCQVTKLIELSEPEFLDFIARPLISRDFIKENVNLMCAWDKHRHCLLVLGENHSDGVLVDAQGYDYARYTSYIPGARDIVAHELDQAVAHLLRELEVDDAGQISIYPDDIAGITGTETGDGSALARMFRCTLEQHSGIAAVEGAGDRLLVTPVSEQLFDDVSGPLFRLRDVLLLGIPANAFLAHEDTDTGLVAASYLAELTETGRERYSELLDAPVSGIQVGVYGPEIVLAGIDAKLLQDFDQAATDHELAEQQMTL